MREKRATESGPSPRFDELRQRVERAAKLIAELREKNHSLDAELTELKRKVASSLEDRPAPHAPTPAAIEAAVHEELQALRDERKIIRAKVQNLLERIEKLEL